jgi:hypothetical protein
MSYDFLNEKFWSYYQCSIVVMATLYVIFAYPFESLLQELYCDRVTFDHILSFSKFFRPLLRPV